MENQSAGEDAGEKLYNLDKLKEMSRGNDAFVNRMITIFTDRLPALLGQIKDAYESKDFKTLYATAHLLKPSIDSMGIVSIKNTIRNIEALAKENPDSASLPENINEIEFILMTVSEQLKKELK